MREKKRKTKQKQCVTYNQYKKIGNCCDVASMGVNYWIAAGSTSTVNCHFKSEQDDGRVPFYSSLAFFFAIGSNLAIPWVRENQAEACYLLYCVRGVSFQSGAGRLSISRQRDELSATFPRVKFNFLSFCARAFTSINISCNKQQQKGEEEEGAQNDGKKNKKKQDLNFLSWKKNAMVNGAHHHLHCIKTTY